MAGGLASCSSSSSAALYSSSDLKRKYDVFITFRGKDTSWNFSRPSWNCSRLYKEWPPLARAIFFLFLVQALAYSYLCRVSLSKHFACCFGELTYIVESKREREVIPVFYGVDPSHVRKQAGSYQDAFQKHEKDCKRDQGTLKKRRASLQKAANFSGYGSESREYRDDNQLIRNNVNDTLQKVEFIYPKSEAQGLVGIDENCGHTEALFKKFQIPMFGSAFGSSKRAFGAPNTRLGSQKWNQHYAKDLCLPGECYIPYTHGSELEEEVQEISRFAPVFFPEYSAELLQDIHHMSCASSCASSTSPHSRKEYDAFLSFRGEETRKKIISHIYAALCRTKVRTYNDGMMEKGDEIWPSLEKAIDDSFLCIVVFSKHYAESTWCLRELTYILESKETGLVMPVFYEIDPSHIRKLTGPVEEAFKKHDTNSTLDKGTVQNWRAALVKAAGICGWDSQSPQYRDEAEFIEKIVEGVKQKLVSRRMIIRRDTSNTTGQSANDMMGRPANDQSRGLLYGLNHKQFHSYSTSPCQGICLERDAHKVRFGMTLGGFELTPIGEARAFLPNC